MQAVVLVGGEGTRLRPLTYSTPKPMVPVLNVPFLERTLVRIRDAGIDDIILPAGHLPAAITEYFGDGKKLDLKLTYVIEETLLGTAGALKNVAQHIKGSFFVLNGDVLTNLDLRAMRAFHAEHGGLATLHLIRVDDPSPFGCVVHDGTARITKFVEKPPRDEAPSNEINAGTYLLDRELLEHIPTGRPVSIERETFPQLIAQGRALYAYTTSDYWIDLGTPEAYLSAHRHVLDGSVPLWAPKSLDDRTIAPSFVGEGVVIEAGAQVGPYAVLGDGVVIGSGSVIRDAVLWDGVVIERNVKVEGAIIASNATIGHGSRVGKGTVIGHNVRIAPETQVADHARIAAEEHAPL